MSLSRATSAFGVLLRFPVGSVHGVRRLVIPATVSKRADTSAEEFPAPSHVNVAAEAASIARQYREFYSDPASEVKLTAETKAAVMAEVTKTVTSMPESDLDENWIKGNLESPDTIRVGDNPLFGSK